MNEMYSMGLSLHSLTSVTVLVMIFINLFFLITYNDLVKYKRVNSLFLIPLTLTLFGVTLFTGIIMMAAKHLDFSFANIMMIIISIVFIILERKRLQSLKYLNISKDHAFNAYKPMARTILQIEFIVVLLLSTAMWVL